MRCAALRRREEDEPRDTIELFYVPNKLGAVKDLVSFNDCNGPTGNSNHLRRETKQTRGEYTDIHTQMACLLTCPSNKR